MRKIMAEAIFVYEEKQVRTVSGRVQDVMDVDERLLRRKINQLRKLLFHVSVARKAERGSRDNQARQKTEVQKRIERKQTQAEYRQDGVGGTGLVEE